MLTSKVKVLRVFFVFVAAFSLLSGLTVLASTDSGKKLLGFRPSVKILLSGSLERDKKTISLDRSVTVKPGEVLNWKMSSENEGNADAQNYSAVANIPSGTEYIAGSAKAEDQAAVSYSIDGGKTFSANPMVEEKQADGTVKQIPAPTALYTQLRFEWNSTLAAGEKLNANYRVRVK